MSLHPTSVTEAGDPPPRRGWENCVLILALLRLSLGILPLLPALIVLLATRAASRVRRPSLWYFSDSLLEGMEELSPRALRMVRRHLAAIGWLLAGAPNRGARPHAPLALILAGGIRPACGARAPPVPA